ncbi:hypothetical protein D3C83_248550 [compost metagenome]
MLFLPSRSPFSASNRFPDGARKSRRSLAALSMSSFRMAVTMISGGSLRIFFPF